MIVISQCSALMLAESATAAKAAAAVTIQINIVLLLLSFSMITFVSVSSVLSLSLFSPPPTRPRGRKWLFGRAAAAAASTAAEAAAGEAAKKAVTAVAVEARVLTNEPAALRRGLLLYQRRYFHLSMIFGATLIFDLYMVSPHQDHAHCH